MKYYFAPLEGITGYLYRNCYHDHFYKMDKYFTPFITPHMNKSFNSRELNDILPENNQNKNVVPQVLTNNSDEFIKTMKELKQLGYTEVNLNLGCPSGTVVSRNRGSGFLSQTDKLHSFLEEVFTMSDIGISIKTRIGKVNPDEFPRLLEIFNEYPMVELIIHPRTQKDYYKGEPDFETFHFAKKYSKNPVCYNGNLFNCKRIEDFKNQNKDIDKIMIGRGLIANPFLIRQIEGNMVSEKETLKNFHNQLLSDYQEHLSGDRNVLFRMKELWFYMIQIFTENERYIKRIRKAERVNDYKIEVAKLFREQEINTEVGFH